jgi:hypothetical protein
MYFLPCRNGFAGGIITEAIFEDGALGAIGQKNPLGFSRPTGNYD